MTAFGMLGEPGFGPMLGPGDPGLLHPPAASHMRVSPGLAGGSGLAVSVFQRVNNACLHCLVHLNVDCSKRVFGEDYRTVIV